MITRLCRCNCSSSPTGLISGPWLAGRGFSEQLLSCCDSGNGRTKPASANVPRASAHSLCRGGSTTAATAGWCLPCEDVCSDVHCTGVLVGVCSVRRALASRSRRPRPRSLCGCAMHATTSWRRREVAVVSLFLRAFPFFTTTNPSYAPAV